MSGLSIRARLLAIRSTGARSHHRDYALRGNERLQQIRASAIGSSTGEKNGLGYDPAHQLTSDVIRDASIDAILRQFFYSYDKAGNRTSEQIDNSVIAATPNNLNQITATGGGGAVRFKGSLNEPGKVTLNGQDAWMSQGGTIFEGNVNLSSGTSTVSVVAKDLSSPPNTRTANYQVTVPAGASKSYGYDSAGNLTGDGSKTYTWDALNRLVKITYANSASSEFTYDAFGRRVKIIEKNSGGTVTETRHFVWDGMEIAERRDASGTLVRRYYPDGYVVGTSGTPATSEKYLYIKDHLGSIRGVFNRDEGAMDVYQDFDAYGRLTLVPWVNDEAADFGFTGHYYHQASGLMLAPFRAYYSELGRWLSRDPLDNAEMQVGPNLYSYVLNNSINWIDPLGLWQVTIGGVGGAGAMITFGHNSGQWNWGGFLGVGKGVFAEWNPNDTGCHKSGLQSGLRAHGEAALKFNFGRRRAVGGSADAFYSNMGVERGASVTLGSKIMSVGFVPDQAGTIGAGGGLFVGIGAVRFTDCD